jgi:D-sedoheptulose 7-phosphate isomerase
MTFDADAARENARRYLRATADTVGLVEASCLDDIVSAAAILVSSLRAGGKILICGNGGSAADAQHLATEFVSTLTTDNVRPSIPAIALTTDTSLLTAIARLGGGCSNARSIARWQQHRRDRTYDGRGPRRRTREIRPPRHRADRGSGASGAPATRPSVPSTVTAHIQECHLAVEQLLASLVEDALYPRPARDPGAPTGND